jgi:protein TonB
MNTPETNFRTIGQSGSQVKTSQKHEANLQQNSGLYFQIGLILCLLATYSLFETQFAHKTVIPEVPETNELAVIDVAQPFQVETIVEKKPKPKKTPGTIITEVISVERNSLQEETRIFNPEETMPAPRELEPGRIPKIEDPGEKDILIPEKLIEKMPIFPGCEKYTTNDQLRQCMSKKVARLINKSFNTSLGSEHGVKGKQKIYAQFTINKNGEVVNVNARGPHPAFEDEAIRVLNKIPNMTPGYQQDKAVGVLYSLPITVLIND